MEYSENKLKEHQQKPLDLSEIQKGLLCILDEFAMLMEKNNIPWFLRGGSLLGAVRHKGFIPWDDDIDVLIPIEYYKRACAILYRKSKYKLLSIWTQDDYVFLQSKLCDRDTILEDETRTGRIYYYERGLAIDLFPLFGADNYFGARKSALDLAMRFMTGHYLRNYRRTEYKGSILTQMAIAADALVFRHDVRYWKRKAFSLILNSSRDNYLTEYWEVPVKWNKEDYVETVYLDFEGRKYPCPIGYDSVLREYIGDYMKLPPVEERHGHPGKKYYYR